MLPKGEVVMAQRDFVSAYKLMPGDGFIKNMAAHKPLFAQKTFMILG